jgi:hypothetical protein
MSRRQARTSIRGRRGVGGVAKPRATRSRAVVRRRKQSHSVLLASLPQDPPTLHMDEMVQQLRKDLPEVPPLSRRSPRRKRG